MNNMYDSPVGAGPAGGAYQAGALDPGGSPGLAGAPDLGSAPGPAGAPDLGSATDLAGAPGPAGAPDLGGRARKRRMLRWGAGITLAGFLAGGGIALAVSGSATPAASASNTARSAGAAVLNSALGTAGNNTANVPLTRIRGALARLRLLGGVHGEFTFRNANGFHTVAFERGTITSVSGSGLVVRAPDGTVWTWLIVGNTVVRENGSKTTTNALADGEAVFTAGPVVNGARDSRLIVIRSGGSGSGSVSGAPGTSVS